MVGVGSRASAGLGAAWILLALLEDAACPGLQRSPTLPTPSSDLPTCFVPAQVATQALPRLLDSQLCVGWLRQGLMVRRLTERMEEEENKDEDWEEL